jgi:Fe-S cluster assembly protein SufB
MSEPEWAYLKFPQIDFQDINILFCPKVAKKIKRLKEVDPELLKTFEKLGISLNEQNDYQMLQLICI